MILDCYKPTLARRFTAASSQHLQHAAAVVSGAACTLACWGNTDSVAANGAAMAISTSPGSGAAQGRRVLFFSSANVIRASAVSASGAGSANGDSASNYATNRWHHAAGVFASTSNTQGYLDGVGGTISTTAADPGAVNITNIGARYGGGGIGAYFSGLIAWPAIWNVALSGAEVAQLAQGAHPLTIRPESLVAFWDFDGRETEFGIKGAYPLTNSGSVPVSAAPGWLRTRIARPWLLGSGYVATTFSPAWASQRTRIIGGGVA